MQHTTRIHHTRTPANSDSFLTNSSCTLASAFLRLLRSHRHCRRQACRAAVARRRSPQRRRDAQLHQEPMLPPCRPPRSAGVRASPARSCAVCGMPAQCRSGAPPTPCRSPAASTPHRHDCFLCLSGWPLGPGPAYCLNMPWSISAALCLKLLKTPPPC